MFTEAWPCWGRRLKGERLTFHPPCWFPLDHQPHGSKEQPTFHFLDFHRGVFSTCCTVIETDFPMVRQFRREPGWRLSGWVALQRTEECLSCRRKNADSKDRIDVVPRVIPLWEFNIEDEVLVGGARLCKSDDGVFRSRFKNMFCRRSSSNWPRLE